MVTGDGSGELIYGDKLRPRYMRLNVTQKRSKDVQDLPEDEELRDIADGG
jgi:hypothetical protein